jgi:voltage-gated potassium channel
VVGQGPVRTVASRDSHGRAILGTAVRSMVTASLLLVAYYLAPLDRPLTVGTLLLLGGALLLFGVFVAVTVRDILRSRRPRLRAIRALIVGVPLLLVVFAGAYFTVAAQQPGAFTEPLNRTDGLYFTVTVFATVGFGDITPVTQLARVLVTIQMLVGVITVGVIAKIIFGAVQTAESRRTEHPVESGMARSSEQ